MTEVQKNVLGVVKGPVHCLQKSYLSSFPQQHGAVVPVLVEVVAAAIVSAQNRSRASYPTVAKSMHGELAVRALLVPLESVAEPSLADDYYQVPLGGDSLQHHWKCQLDHPLECAGAALSGSAPCHGHLPDLSSPIAQAASV